MQKEKVTIEIKLILFLNFKRKKNILKKNIKFRNSNNTYN